jgi:mono/diheme cytochrome c family protein/peroxiredoxin
MASDSAQARPAGWRWLLAGPFLVMIVTAAAFGAWLVRERLTVPASQPPTSSQARTDPVALKRGRLLYQVTCLSCHGPEGRGDGPSALQMNPPPRDFAEGPWKFGTVPDLVRKVIRDGIPATPMPGSPGLSDTDLDALTAYVLTFAPRSPPGLSATLSQQLRAAGFTPVESPREAPPLELLDLDGKPVSLAQFRGNLVLVNFWGTDCVHCLAELPDLERLAEALAPRVDQPGVVVVPVCFDETDRQVVGKVARQHVQRLPVFVDPRGLGKLRFDAQVLPSTYLIDPRGRLVGSATGRHAWSAQELKQLLAAFSTP